MSGGDVSDCKARTVSRYCRAVPRAGDALSAPGVAVWRPGFAQGGSEPWDCGWKGAACYQGRLKEQ